MLASTQVKCGGEKLLSYSICGNKESLESNMAGVSNKKKIPFGQTVLLLGYLSQRNKNTHTI